MTQRILIVDDEPDTVELIDFNLKHAGYETLTARDGAVAFEQARSFLPDLIVLDLMLPVIDGFEVCKLLRRDPGTAVIPVIMLTAKASEIDRVLGLELGADDYLTKPFSPRELMLRIKGLLRRGRKIEDKADRFTVDDLTIDVARHQVLVAGKRVELTATEFKLLTLLVQRQGRVQSREQLLREVWQYEGCIDTRTVDTHMRRLRVKLKGASKCLDTVRGLGYRVLEA